MGCLISVPGDGNGSGGKNVTKWIELISHLWIMCFLNRDRAPFVLTSDMAYVINGGEKPTIRFQLFVDLCCQAYNLIRKHANLFLNLLSLVSIFIKVSWNSICNAGLLLNPKFFMLQELQMYSFKSRNTRCIFLGRLYVMIFLGFFSFSLSLSFSLSFPLPPESLKLRWSYKLLCKGDMI